MLWDDRPEMLQEEWVSASPAGSRAMPAETPETLRAFGRETHRLRVQGCRCGRAPRGESGPPCLVDWRSAGHYPPPWELRRSRRIAPSRVSTADAGAVRV